MSTSLTLQHDRVRYLLPDVPESRKLIHRYIEVFEYPDGRIELRADGMSLEHVRYDKLPFIDAGAIVEDKRLGHALKVAQLIQAERDDRRAFANKLQIEAASNKGSLGQETTPRLHP